MPDPIAWLVEQIERKSLPGDGRPDEPVSRATLAVRNAVTTQWRTRSQIAAITGAAKNTMAIELRRMAADGEIEVRRGTGNQPDQYRRL